MHSDGQTIPKRGRRARFAGRLGALALCFFLLTQAAVPARADGTTNGVQINLCTSIGALLASLFGLSFTECGNGFILPLRFKKIKVIGSRIIGVDKEGRPIFAPVITILSGNANFRIKGSSLGKI